MKLNIILIGLIAIMFVISTSCKKLVDVSPPSTTLTRATVFSDSATATAAINGVYSKMAEYQGIFGGQAGVSLRCGLLSDEFKFFSSDHILLGFYENGLDQKNDYFWAEFYQLLYQTNSILDGLSSSSIASRKKLSGEAKFLRAYLNFYLTNLYGDIPLVTTIDYQLNNRLSRSPQSDVYALIIADLKDAVSQLQDEFIGGNGKSSILRIRPNKAAAHALLARVLLYTGKFNDAESEAATVINDPRFQLDASLDKVFLKGSQEAIWQLAPVQDGFNTYDGRTFILESNPNEITPVSLSNSLLKSFETGDARLSNWVGLFVNGTDSFYYPYKYKVGANSTDVTEYTTILRLAEQYLIRAEARLRQGKLDLAINDINQIRARANLGKFTSVSSKEIQDELVKQRRCEFFSEWGHRWFDLKRWGIANTVMGIETPLKGGTWSVDDQLLPIPQSELSVNKNLRQNPGY